jgi:hypothetical protein
MTKLIALAALAAGAFAEVSVDIAEGAAFEVSPEAAEPLLTQGLAKLEGAPLASTNQPTKTKSVKVRVLVDSALGRANDVVSLSTADAKAAEINGIADASKEAVAFALTLEQNQS